MRTSTFLRTIEFVEDFLRTSKLDYSFSQRVSLLRTRLSRQEQIDLLNFKVRRLGLGSFRIILKEIFFQGEYRFESDLESPLIFDCGANIGLATLFFKHFYPQARVVAFEADPKIAAVLSENVSVNKLQDVSVQNLMLAKEEGDYTFFAGDHGSLMGSAKPGRKSGTEIEVRGARLSQFVNETVHLLKLDVEGAESEVLADLIATGKIDLIERMVIEYHHKINDADSSFADFLAMIEKNGFEYQIAANGCDPITLQGVTQDVLLGAYRRPRASSLDR